MAKRRKRRRYRRLKQFIKFCLVVGGLCAFVGAMYAYSMYDDATKDMPSIDGLLAAQETSTKILDRNGILIGELGNEIRIPIPFDKMAKPIFNALVASEDATFWENDGLYYSGIARALVVNFLAGSHKQGASTITQQLVKLLIVGTEKTYSRKLREAILARQVKEKYSNELILQTYLNTVNFGYNRRGIEAAANFYFGKHAADLNDSEAAMLVGILPSPAKWSPLKNMTIALAKMKRVLNRMKTTGKITDAAFQYALANPPVIVPYKSEEARDGQEVIDAVRKFLEGTFSQNEINHLGLTIWTTVDIKVQSTVKRALKDNNKQIGGRYYPEGAVVVMDTERRIIALVGGADYAPGGQNRALEAWRQPGSTFKGLVYAAGFEAGKFGPNSVFSNVLTEFTVPGAKSWSPENYRGEASDRPTFGLTEAYAESLNRVAAKAICGLWPGSGVENATEIELDYCRKHGLVYQTINLAERAGIKWNERDRPVGNPSIALGSNGVTPMGMLNAYMSVSYDGNYIQPQLITKIEGDKAPNLPDRERHSVVSEQTVAKMRIIMRAVIEEGTGRGAKGKLPEIGYGKTGTTNNSTNAWFVGGTDSYWAIVWVGHKNQNTTLGRNATGANTALPVWTVAINAAYGRESTAVSEMRNRRAATASVEEPEVDEESETKASADDQAPAPAAGDQNVPNTDYDQAEGSGTVVPDDNAGSGTQVPTPAPTPVPSSATDDDYANAQGSGTEVPAQ